jgi:hypothetical protein
MRVASCIYACSVTFHHDDGVERCEKCSRETFAIDNEIGINPVILAVEDVHETRDAQRQPPDLILVSLAGTQQHEENF